MQEALLYVLVYLRCKMEALHIVFIRSNSVVNVSVPTRHTKGLVLFRHLQNEVKSSK